MSKKRLREVCSIFLVLVFMVVSKGVLGDRQAVQAFAGGDTAQVLILMYHHITDIPGKLGEFCLDVDTFEKDLKELQSRGYKTVVLQDLIDFVYEGKKLPQKAVAITIDDGNLTDFTQVLPLLQQYDMKAVSSIIGANTDRSSQGMGHNQNDASMSWTEVQGLARSGRVELQNHSYDFHQLGDRQGSQRKEGESAEDYQKIFREDTLKMQQRMVEHLGLRPTFYTYPYGFISQESQTVLKELGYKGSLSVKRGINVISRLSPGSLFELKRVNRPSGISSAEFFGALETNYPLA